MNRAGDATSGGLTHLSLAGSQKQEDKTATDSGAIDSGFHSGQNLSSDNFSSSELAPQEPQSFQSDASQRQAQVASYLQQQQQQHPHKQLEEDSQTFDSGVDVDSSQQFHSGEPMRVDNVNDLCKGILQMNVSRKEPQLQRAKLEKYFLQNDDGDTYFHMAVICKATEIVYKLIRAAPRPWLDIQNDHGRTALHLSVLTKQPEMVRRLLVAGAQPGIRDIEGNTPLHLACQNGDTDCVKELLTPLSDLELQQISPAARAMIKLPQDLEQWNFNGKRCVHLAVESRNIEILSYLIRAGADANSREGKAGFTALHMAVESNSWEVIKFLLYDCPKLRLEQVTYAGLTAYQLAAIQHNKMLQEKLSKRGAEPLSPPESDYEDDESEEDEQE